MKNHAKNLIMKKQKGENANSKKFKRKMKRSAKKNKRKNGQMEETNEEPKGNGRPITEQSEPRTCYQGHDLNLPPRPEVDVDFFFLFSFFGPRCPCVSSFCFFFLFWNFILLGPNEGGGPKGEGAGG